MEAVIHYEPMEDEIKVFLVRRSAESHVSQFFTFDRGAVVGHERGEGGTIDPALVINASFGAELFRVLGKAIVDSGHYRPVEKPALPTEDVRAHLSDVIALRDRLLAIVERP